MCKYFFLLLYLHKFTTELDRTQSKTPTLTIHSSLATDIWNLQIK